MRRGSPQLTAFAVNDAPSIIAAIGNNVPSFKTPLSHPNVPPSKNIIVVYTDEALPASSRKNPI
jgi:hypothetical protein